LAVARGAGALATGLGLAGGAVRSAAAHHSYPATYDTAQRVTVNGVVQLVRFTNPHVHIVIESPIVNPVAGAEPAPEAAAETVIESPAVELAPESETSFAESSVSALTTDAALVAEPGAEGVEAGASPASPVVQPAADAAPVPEVPASTLWVLDLPGPARAQRLGLTPEALPPGTPLTVVAWPSRSPGSHDLAPLTIALDAIGQLIRIR
jgi:hypothetical protein